MENNNVITISASRLKTFKLCARQYYYKYIIPHQDRHEEKVNVGALLGTALHHAIEERYNGNSEYMFAFQQKLNDTFMEWQNKGKEVLGGQYFSLQQKTGNAILKAFDWERFNPLEVELEFTLPFPNAESPIVFINGFIDLITVDGNVIDHKSSKKLPHKEEIDNDIQFIIYYWAYTQLYGQPPKNIFWNHLRTNELIRVDVENNYANKLRQLTSDIQALLSLEIFARKNIDSFCRELCSFYRLCYPQD